jgi:DNA segregation ATPase FtsK/SpoIIIE, S-DNA-T family
MISTILKWTVNLLFSLAGLIIVWAIKCAFKLTCWSVRQMLMHPRTSTGLGVLGGAVLAVGWETVVTLIGIVIVAGSTWKAAHAATFDRYIMSFLRTWMRRWWTYSRVWERVMRRCGLCVEIDDERHVPELRKVSTTPYWDRLVLRMQVGQEVEDYQSAAGRIRHAFGAERIAVREVVPGGVGIDLMRRDPFRYERVPAAAMPAATADIDFTALPVGITEHLAPFCVSVVGGMTAVSGASGSGKASFEWDVMRCVAPAIADGTVRLVFIDPKGRELRQGRALLRSPDDYASDAESVLALLERLQAELEEVNEALGDAGERDHVPSPATPLVLILIDELAPLLAYWPRRIRDKIEDALGIILTQGRAAGYIVIGEIQEPTKDIFKQRDLFFRRLGLRLPTEAHTDAALTDDAVDRGAFCHTIPESLPGVLYAIADGERTATRARLGHVTDADIAELVDFVQQLRTVTPIDARRRVEDKKLEVA